MATICSSSNAAAFALAKIPTPFSHVRNLTQSISTHARYRSTATCHVYASVSTVTPMPTKRPVDDFVQDIISKVTQTDRGVLLTKDEHQKVAQVASEFGEWDVLYCSNPTSPGGGYRSAFGRLIFKTKEMIQVVEAPNTVRNRVAFTLLGFVDGEVSLKGKLTALDEKWIQLVFEPPELKVGGLEFKYGGESEVKLEITYVDEKIRLGKGSRGSLFVFYRI